MERYHFIGTRFRGDDFAGEIVGYSEDLYLINIDGEAGDWFITREGMSELMIEVNDARN